MGGVFCYAFFSGLFLIFTSSPVQVTLQCWVYNGSADLTCSETDLVTLPLLCSKKMCMGTADQLMLEGILIWL